MKLASYNLENLFLRARAMNGEAYTDGKKALEAHAELGVILAKPTYTGADKAKIIRLLETLRLDKADDPGPNGFAVLRQNRGRLLKRSRDGVEIVAEGRADWIGWVELKREEVNEEATRNTARVINDVGADVLGVIEAESRPALVRFNENLIGAMGGVPYAHALLIDGNDDRGIDVGLYAREAYEVEAIRTHVDDSDAQGRIFSRDCAHYEVRTPQGNALHVLVNHFKSKGFGSQTTSNLRRQRQAARVKQIYARLRESETYVAVIGDLNDTPDSAPLVPLLRQTDLKDISEHASFDDGGRPGTFANGTAANKIDYILLSPALFDAARAGGIFRLGVWGGRNGTLFPHYPEITRAVEAASDHAAIWADIDI
ncbi:endonuclease/exonuclease/phosphatase family protein [Methylosinus sp. Sm6]|uniref:endonuclease/exonuclease/phosphatase family protein n=1 Tax=Methylosinus sp. Sm6 TaxID=2866948 RepID=UPI001C9A116C|nr:endonuclease/exonuclease/phosphatase family protein [Methylosinus sp. Sm6]MBY6240750.1 endonuclease/exonuclease/phosphatase family protein [Methylosinus sp. Sm6]